MEEKYNIQFKQSDYEIKEVFSVGGQATIYRTEGGMLIKAYCPSYAFRDKNGKLVPESEIWDEELEQFVKNIVSAEERSKEFCGKSHQSQFCSWDFDEDHMTAIMKAAPADCKTLLHIIEEWETAPPVRAGEEYRDLERVRQSLRIIRSLLGAVDELHQTGLLHLDLSASNVIFGKNLGDSTAYPIDLASNRKIGSLASSCTEASAGYASPEVKQRWDKEQLTPAADLYSVGALILILSCGKKATYRMPEVRDLPGDGNVNVTDPVSELDVPKSVRDGLIQIIVKATTRFDEYYGKRPQGQDGLRPTEEMLQDLMELEEKCRPMSFPLQRGLPGMLDTGRFQGRQKESRELLKYLDGGQKSVYVWGDGGLGKTEFVITFATRNERKYNWYYTTFQGDIRRTVLGLKFKGWSTERIMPSGKREIKTEEEQYEEKLQLLAKCDSDSVLIIDNYDGDPKQLLEDEGLERLNELDIRIVYTTRNEFEGESCIQIRPLEAEQLLKLVQYYLQGRTYSEDVLIALIEQVERNTLIVDIIARLMSSSIRPLNANELLEKLKKSTWNDKLLSKQVFSDYNQKNARRTALGHLQTLFDVSGLREEAAYVMSCACMIPESGVDAVLFLECMDDADEVVESLRDTGWLKHDKLINQISIHPLIRAVCFHDRRVKPSYPEIKPFWENLLSCKTEKTQYAQVGEILQSLMNRLGQHIPPILWAQTQNVLTDLEYKMCKYIAAKERGEKLYEYLALNLPDEHELARENCFTLGVICNHLSTFSAAVRYLEEALKHQKELPENPEKEADLNIHLGRAKVDNLSRPFLDEASECFEKALALLPKKSKKRADCIDGQGLLYHRKGDRQKAYDAFRDALEIRKEILPEDDYEFSYSLSYLGLILLEMKRYPEAIREIEESLRISEKHDLQQDLNLAVDYYNLGTCHLELEDYQSALDNYLEVQRIYEASLPENHPDRASISCRIGICYGKLRNWERCLKWLENAINSAEAVELNNRLNRDLFQCDSIDAGWSKRSLLCLFEMLLSNHAEQSRYDIRVVKQYYLIGRYYEHVKDWRNSSKYYAKALLNHELSCLSSRKDAMDRDLVFDLHLRLGRVDFERANKIWKKQKDPFYLHLDLDTVFRDANINNSLKHFKEAFAYWREQQQSMSLRIVAYYEKYGDCHRIAGHWNEAADIYQRVLPWYNLNQDPLRRSASTIYLSGKLVRCCRKAGRWQACVDTFLQNRIYLQDADLSCESELALDVGLAYHSMNDNNEALIYLLQCEQNQLRRIVLSRPDRIDLYRALSEVYGSLGNSERQQRYAALADKVSQN